MLDKNQIFAAPMAGISDLPFRTIIRDFVPELPVVTEYREVMERIEGFVGK